MKRSSFALGRDNVLQMRFFLHGRDARRVPASSQRFHQQHLGHQALPLDDGGFLLIAYQILLRAHHV